MKRRGFALVLTLAVLVVLATAIVLAARIATATVADARQAARREAAVRQAESALEAARAALARGELQPGGTLALNATTVACRAVPGGVLLEAEATYWPEHLKRTRELRRAVRVGWVLARENEGEGHYRLAEFTIRNVVRQAGKGNR